MGRQSPLSDLVDQITACLPRITHSAISAMTRATIAAALLAGSVALSPAPARAYDSLTLFSIGVAGVILTPPGFSSTLLSYSIPASYGPRHSYSSYGGYANVGKPV